MSPVLSNKSNIPNTLVRNGVSKHVETKTKTPHGKPAWDWRLTGKQNRQQMTQIGKKAHDVVSNRSTFKTKYPNQNTSISKGMGGRPDGWYLNKTQKLIRLAEIKSDTKTGQMKGIRQLNRYTKWVKENYKDYTIETELFLYRSLVPTIYEVESGDNLSVIGQKYGVTAEDIMQLNDLESTVIHPGDELFIDFEIIDVDCNESCEPEQNTSEPQNIFEKAVEWYRNDSKERQLNELPKL